MSFKLGVIMDPIERITYAKDGTLRILLEAQRRGLSLYYIEQKDLFLRDGTTWAHMQMLKVYDDPDHWFDRSEAPTTQLHSLNAVLMRKDPPFDMEYIYTTYLLERAEAEGLFVLNKPSALRDANEKLFTAWFPQCCPSTLVAREESLLRSFLDEEKDIVLKPLDGMGGESVFRLKKGDINTSVAIELLTRNGTRSVMAQRFIPKIKKGDKRIFIIDGEAFPYALARIPVQGELRANLAAGGKGVGAKLTKRDRWICEKVGPILREKGLFFVGLDVIGDYLTEINVTCPTGMRQVAGFFDEDPCKPFIDCVLRYTKPHP